MKGLLPALWAELLKVRRSKIFWISILVALFMASMMGFIMFVLKYPEYARKYGLIAAKARFVGQADWPSFLKLLTQVIAAAGILGFGFVTSWTFGREYSDRTVKDLLSLPVSRSTIILSKFIVVAVWCVFLSFLLIVLGFSAGKIVGLTGLTPEILERGKDTYAVVCVLTIILSAPIAFFASIGRGYLPPLGFVILMVMLAQLIAGLGYGQFFPWAIPALLCGAAGPESSHLGSVSYIIVVLTGILGAIGTFLWWRFADQT